MGPDQDTVGKAQVGEDSVNSLMTRGRRRSNARLWWISSGGSVDEAVAQSGDQSGRSGTRRPQSRALAAPRTSRPPTSPGEMGLLSAVIYTHAACPARAKDGSASLEQGTSLA